MHSNIGCIESSSALVITRQCRTAKNRAAIWYGNGDRRIDPTLKVQLCSMDVQWFLHNSKELAPTSTASTAGPGTSAPAPPSTTPPGAERGRAPAGGGRRGAPAAPPCSPPSCGEQIIVTCIRHSFAERERREQPTSPGPSVTRTQWPQPTILYYVPVYKRGRNITDTCFVIDSAGKPNF